jgi:hypothetical protein
VPAASTLPRERDRKQAETVAILLDQTAAIGAKAISRRSDHTKLQAALDALWKPRFHVEQMSRTLSVDDAIVFCTSRSRGKEES